MIGAQGLVMHVCVRTVCGVQVREYSRVFWQRHQELGDWERVIKNIERGAPPFLYISICTLLLLLLTHCAGLGSKVLSGRERVGRALEGCALASLTRHCNP